MSEAQSRDSKWPRQGASLNGHSLTPYRYVPVVAALLILSAFQSGCADAASAPEPTKSTSPPANTVAGDPVALSQFGERFLSAACQLLLTCQEGGRHRVLLGTEERCVRELGAAHAPDLAGRVEAVAKGRFSYDSAEAARCLQRVSNACGQFPYGGAWRALELWCGAAFDGNVPPGGACNGHVECQGDAYCSDTFGNCSGVCLPAAGLGQPCAEQQCNHQQPGGPLVCSKITQTCVPMVRGKEAESGQECGGRDNGTEYRFSACDAGLACQTEEDSENRRCQPHRELGERCTSDLDACVAGALCLPETETEELSCQRLHISGLGESCEDPRSSCDPLDRLRCGTDSLCQLRGDGNDRSACRAVAASACNPGLYCYAEPEMEEHGTCLPAAALGESCDAHHGCLSRRCSRTDDDWQCGRQYCSDAAY